MIRNYAAVVSDDLPAEGPLRENFEQIRLAAERAAALTHELLLFSRREHVEPEVVSLSDVVAGVEGLLRGGLGDRVELVVDVQPDVAPVLAHAGQVEQLLLNIAVNARDAMPEGGRLTIETRCEELDDDWCRSRPGTVAGSYSVLRVCDGGDGMERDVAARAVDPFFTTKPQGTGLGLATVYGIVQQAGGHVEIESAPGEGTTVTVYFRPAGAS